MKLGIYETKKVAWPFFTRKFLIRLIKPISADFGTFWNFLRKRFIRFGKIWTQSGRQIGKTYALYHIFGKILNQAN